MINLEALGTFNKSSKALVNTLPKIGVNFPAWAKGLQTIYQEIDSCGKCIKMYIRDSNGEAIKIRQKLIGVIHSVKTEGSSSCYNMHALYCFFCIRRMDHEAGRIAILWDPRLVNMEVIVMDIQVVHAAITCTVTTTKFLASSMYGLHSVVARRPLWQSLMQFGTNLATVVGYGIL
ncbi:hypothetical protein M9H77_29489 [Catharanthus roseus]|uniref:Uncharacterized protein n=1 Tax=Catharanthus roseus TaxID=4058 RepID=A0ACB9ZUK3_CATRO|nr:hypothetical protein M9H77_29489 [Catharanthus roseus]